MFWTFRSTWTEFEVTFEKAEQIFLRIRIFIKDAGGILKIQNFLYSFKKLLKIIWIMNDEYKWERKASRYSSCRYAIYGNKIWSEGIRRNLCALNRDYCRDNDLLQFVSRAFEDTWRDSCSCIHLRNYMERVKWLKQGEKKGISSLYSAFKGILLNPHLSPLYINYDFELIRERLNNRWFLCVYMVHVNFLRYERTK
jgi:hypothetical protein